MANGKNFAASAQGASCADVQSTKQTESILNLSNREIAKSFCRIKSFSYLCNATEPYCTVYKVHKSLWAYLRCASTPCSGGSVARIGGAPSFYAINWLVFNKMRQNNTSGKANNSTLTAPVSELQDILNLSNREIAIRLQSLSLDDLEKLAPLLRVLMYVVLTRESHAAEEHRTNSNLWSGDGLY